MSVIPFLLLLTAPQSFLIQPTVFIFSVGYLAVSMIIFNILLSGLFLVMEYSKKLWKRWTFYHTTSCLILFTVLKLVRPETLTLEWSKMPQFYFLLIFCGIISTIVLVLKNHTEKTSAID